MFRIGIDLGGTNIAAGTVNEKYEITGRASVKTELPRSAEEIAERMEKAARAACDAAGVDIKDAESIGIGAPGAVNPETGVISFSSNLGFHNVALAEMLGKRLNKKCFIENDANAAAYGEFIAGAGKGCKNFVLATLGTGVGCGIILNGKIYSGSNFAGGELGHTVLIKDGKECACGRRGCFEKYASATALTEQTKEAMAAAPESLMWKVCGNNSDAVNGKTAFDAAGMGDAAAKAVIARFCEYLAAGLINTVNLLQPDMLCIGGGVSGAGEALIAPVRQLVKREDYARDCGKTVKISAATLGNDAGIIGSAFLGFDA